MDRNSSELRKKAAADDPASAIPEQLLEVAANLFAEFGLEGLKIREISRQTGFPIPTIYYYFQSKENLYEKAFARKIESTISMIDARIQGTENKLEKFASLVEAFFDLFTSDRILWLLIQRDMIDAATQLRPQLSSQQYAHFASLIEGVATDLLGRDVDPKFAQSIGALILGTCSMTAISLEYHGEGAEAYLKDQRNYLVKVAMALLRVG